MRRGNKIRASSDFYCDGKCSTLLKIIGPAEYISTSSVIFAKPTLGFREAVLVRDPDGHAVRVIEP